MSKRTVYVYRQGHGVVTREEAWEIDMKTEGGKSAYVISDTIIDGMWCPLDNKVHHSKSAIRNVARSMGMEEVGNEKLSDRREPIRKTTRDDFDRAISMLNQGYRPPERYEGEL